MEQKVKSKPNASKLKICLSAVALFISALIFNALFNFMTLEKLQTESAALRFHIIGEEFRREIQTAIAAGQDIRDIKGIGDKPAAAKKRMAQFFLKTVSLNEGDATSFSDFNTGVSICLPDGQLLYSSEKDQLNTRVTLRLEDPNNSKKEKRSFLGRSTVITLKGKQFLQFPVQDAKNDWKATVIISFEKKQPTDRFKDHLKNQTVLFCAVLLIGIVQLVFFLNIVFSRALSTGKIPKQKIILVMFFIIGPILLIFSSLNTFQSTKNYLSICQKKAGMTVTLVKEDIESLLNQGLTLEGAIAEDAGLREMLKFYPVLDALTILDKAGRPVREVRQSGIQNASASYEWLAAFLFSEFSFSGQAWRQEIFKEKAVSGYADIRISKDRIAREMVNMILNAVTVVAISILFLVELLIFVFCFIDEPVYRKDTSAPVRYNLIRPVTFLFLFGIDISISFIPLHMEKLFTPMFGLSRNAVMGLPISVEFFFVGIAIFLCGFWNDRRGWHEPFLAGLFLAGTGVLYSWAAPNMVHFVISRAIVGIGYGLTLLAAQGFVIAFSDEKAKARAFAQFIAGLYAGSICGGATGALLAEKVGYRWVFFIGAVILYSIIVYALIFMRQAMVRPKRHPAVEMQASVSVKSIFSGFLKNRIVLSLIFLSSLPASIVSVGFLNYFSPIYLNRIGASQATIGRVLMIYGFSLVYLGPVIGKFVDRSDNKRNYVFVGCLLGSIAFLMFYFLDGLFAATMAVLLLGLSNSYIIASQSTYLLKLKVTYALGPGKALGIFRASSRIGQSLGPIVFSGLFMSANLNTSITKLGIFYLLTAVLFLIFTQKDAHHYARNS